MFEDSTAASPSPPIALMPESPLTLPAIYVNVDVNDLLDSMTEEQVFEFLGKLKDLFNA